jgi:hypothetical protein
MNVYHLELFIILALRPPYVRSVDTAQRTVPVPRCQDNTLDVGNLILIVLLTIDSIDYLYAF